MNFGAVATFLVIDLLLVLTPGADWAFTIAAGIRDRSVVPAVTGLVIGYAGHVILVTAGLAALVAANLGLLKGLTAVGAAYLIWMGASVLVKPPAEVQLAAPSPGRIALRGVGVSGLNPKGMLLTVALLPQFVRPDAPWPIALQTATLGVLHMVLCAVIYLMVGLLARTVLGARPRAAAIVSRVSGVAMVLIGASLLLT
ncbi:LysE family translocator [Kibdelosporangium philippinense]|uniref:LysE family translocator n=1 Tax=Kibdelosporangium philippinense TaxID=211113 RepID=A0ABS8ZW84_9PSEU|nr:LysE family translocator [Kibdelosporangium philippinense]MCE7011275.1 LysE family translocator [Kibdelosporangium philippinense]